MTVKKETFRKDKHIARRISSNHSTDLGDEKEFVFTKEIYKSKKFSYVGKIYPGYLIKSWKVVGVDKQIKDSIKHFLKKECRQVNERRNKSGKPA